MRGIRTGRVRTVPVVSAYTLVEAIVAMAVFGITFVGLYAGITQGFAMVRQARESLAATQVLQRKFETIRLYNWDQVNNAAFLLPNFSVPLYPGQANASYAGTVTVANPAFVEPYASDLRTVTVQLTWTNSGRLCTRTMTSLVARYGLQTYIY